MGSSNLKWVNGPTRRAQDVSNEAVDKYKTIVQQLYLDQNMTREEVLTHLKEGHGFSLSTNQFSKATKRWGFYKQPRHGRAANPPTQSIIKEYEAYDPFDLQEELLKMEPDALDTIDDIEACSQTGSENVTISQILEDVQGQFPFIGSNLVSEAPPSINHSLSQAMDLDFLCGAQPCDTVRNRPENFKRRHEQLETARKRPKGPHSTSSKTIPRVPFDNRNKSHVEYLTCCYLFQEAVDCLERSETSSETRVDKRKHQVTGSNIEKLFAKYRRDKDKLLASPNSSLDLWSIICLLELDQLDISDDILLDRLDTNDLQFMTAVRNCLKFCEIWIELVGKGLPNGAFQFDSLFLHQTAGKAVHNACLPLHEQNHFDIWLEAGYLFAFIWGNEKLRAVNYWSWLREAEISGLSPTYFLAIICQMIVYMTSISSPNFWMIKCKGDDAAESICMAYLQTIEQIRRTDESRSFKSLFIDFLFDHHSGYDMEPEERRTLESVQSYQRRAADYVLEQETNDLAQEVSQATTLHGDFLTTGCGSLASNRSTNPLLYPSSYSYSYQQYLTLRSANPTITRSLASGSSRGSSLNSLRAFQAASKAIARRLKEDQDE